MDSEKIIITVVFLFAVLFPFAVGFFSGYKWNSCKDTVITKTDTVVQYEQLTDTVKITHVEPKYIVKRDTVVRYVDMSSQDVDSALTDYYRVRLYTLDYSTDTTGTYTVEVDVSENKIMDATATVIPLQKTVTVTQTVEQAVKKFRPFVSVGTDLRLNSQNVTGGVVISNNYMFSVAGLRCDGEYGYSFNFGYIFR